MGVWQDENFLDRGFLLVRGAFQDIEFPGAPETDAFAINVLGVIVGDYLDADGNFHGYVRTPQRHEGVASADGPDD